MEKTKTQARKTIIYFNRDAEPVTNSPIERKHFELLKEIAELLDRSRPTIAGETLKKMEETVDITDGRLLAEFYNPVWEIAYFLIKEITEEKIVQAVRDNDREKLKAYDEELDKAAKKYKEILELNKQGTQKIIDSFFYSVDTLKDANGAEVEVVRPLKKNPQKITANNKNFQNLVQRSRFNEVVTSTSLVHGNLSKVNLNSSKKRKFNVNGRKKKPCNIWVLLSLEDEGITTSKKLTPFQVNVHDAIFSMWVQRFENTGEITQLYTPEQIFKHLTGGVKRKLKSETTRKEIIRSLEILTACFAGIDWNEQFEQEGLTAAEISETFNNITPIHVKGHLLELQFIKAETPKGEIRTLIKITNAPLLYEYSDVINQISRVSLEQKKAIFENIKPTISNISIAEYLLRRVQIYESKVKRNLKGAQLHTFKIINIEEIYKQSNRKNLDTTAKKRITKNTFQMLENIGYERTFIVQENKKKLKPCYFE